MLAIHFEILFYFNTYYPQDHYVFWPQKIPSFMICLTVSFDLSLLIFHGTFHFWLETCDLSFFTWLDSTDFQAWLISLDLNIDFSFVISHSLTVKCELSLFNCLLLIHSLNPILVVIKVLSIITLHNWFIFLHLTIFTHKSILTTFDLSFLTYFFCNAIDLSLLTCHSLFVISALNYWT